MSLVAISVRCTSWSVPCFLQVVPSTAIGFTLYDSAKQFLGLKGNI